MRFHEPPVLPCIFGCHEGGDQLAHYSNCDPFWTIMCSCAKLSAHWLPCPPMQRFCFPEPNCHNLLLCGMMFKTYHALRKDYDNLVRKAAASFDFSEVIIKAVALANIFGGELGLREGFVNRPQWRD